MRSPLTSRSTPARALAALAAVSLGVAACSSPDSDPAASGGSVVGLQGSSPVLLQSGRSCDAVLEDFQALAPTILQGSFGADGTGFDDVAEFEGDMSTSAGAAASDETAQPAAAPDSAAREEGAAGGGTSDTNTQEEGIDEPDVVETDGDFVYLVDGEVLVILDGATAEVVSRTQLAGFGAQIMLSGDRILAITGGGYAIAEMGAGVDGSGGRVEPDPGLVDPPSEEPTTDDTPTDDTTTEEPATEPSPDEPVTIEPVPEPGTEPEPVPEPGPSPEPLPVEPEPIPVEPQPIPVEPPSFQTGTVIQLIDVADRASPTIVQTTEIEGQHVSTRVVDGVARVVITSYPHQPQMSVMPAGAESGRIDQAAVEEAIEDSVDDTVIEDWLPAFRTTTMTDDEPRSVEGTAVECEDVLVPEVNAGIAETSVLRVDFEDGFDPADTTTVVAEAGTVYASASNLYLAATRYVAPDAQADIAEEDWATALHVFDLRGDGPARHVGAGEVPGSTLNQYSLSEHDGHLRIATTEGTPWGQGEQSESAVRVLRLDGDRLTEVGVVGGLGRTETIQSVRFMGPVGYVVTFRQTDPLYVIDLSDPAAPAAVGELKIPGFSSYLHPVGEGRLVGIGRDATLEGQDQGLLVSLFDVSDPTDPKQVQTYTERDAHSAAGTDPKAFLWWAPESAVVVPVERFGVQAQARPSGFDAGMLVLDIDDAGITERAVVRADDGRYPIRSLVVQDRLWSVFDGAVVTSSFDQLTGGTVHPLR